MEEQEESDDCEPAPGTDEPIAEATTARATFQVPESAAIRRKHVEGIKSLTGNI